MNSNTVSAGIQGSPNRLSQPDRSARESGRLLPARAALSVIALSSLGLWTVIWWAASFLPLLRLW